MKGCQKCDYLRDLSELAKRGHAVAQQLPLWGLAEKHAQDTGHRLDDGRQRHVVQSYQNGDRVQAVALVWDLPGRDDPGPLHAVPGDHGTVEHVERWSWPTVRFDMTRSATMAVPGLEIVRVDDSGGDVSRPDFVLHESDMNLSASIAEVFADITDQNDGPVDPFVVISRACGMVASGLCDPDDAAEAVFQALRAWPTIKEAVDGALDAPSTELPGHLDGSGI